MSKPKIKVTDPYTQIPSFDDVRTKVAREGVNSSPNIDPTKSDRWLNEESFRPMFVTTRAYFIFTIGLAIVIANGVAAWGYQIITGMGVTGLRHPVFWGIYISTFVFWVGVSHSGTIVSCLLRLSKANWRRPILRAAEAMTAFALLVAAMFPLIHVGRLWRIYYTFPLPNQRELWPNFRSPLAWDMTAISVYLTASMLFLYVGMLPDLAMARDLCPKDNWRKTYLTFLSLGWRGTNREWHFYEKATAYMAVIVLLIAPSVHTIVSWDFAMSITPGWHTTIFGPYFVIGAIYSGVAGVITLMVLMRWIWKLENVIKIVHLNNLAKLLLCIALLWSYFYFVEFMVVWYGHKPTEYRIWEWQGSRFGHNLIIMLGGAAFSVFALSWHRVRTSPILLFFVTVWINVDMYIERYMIVAPILSRRDNPFMWSDYFPSPVEISIAVAAFCYFVFLYAVFFKTMPGITVADIKEGQVISTDMRLGNRFIRVQGKPDE